MLQVNIPTQLFWVVLEWHESLTRNETTKKEFWNLPIFLRGENGGSRVCSLRE